MRNKRSKYIPFKRYSQGQSFLYVGQTPRSRTQGNFFGTLVTRSTHMKYQSTSTYQSKYITKVKDVRDRDHMIAANR
jgi:hypothetical protein